MESKEITEYYRLLEEIEKLERVKQKLHSEIFNFELVFALMKKRPNYKEGTQEILRAAKEFGISVSGNFDDVKREYARCIYSIMNKRKELSSMYMEASYEFGVKPNNDVNTDNSIISRFK